MPDSREALGLEIAAALRRANFADMRGQLVAAVVDAGLSLRLRPIRVVRPDDLLVLDFELDNLVPGGGVLKRRDTSLPGLLIVTHPLQSIAEHAFLDMDGQESGYGDDEDSGDETPALLPAAARAAGPSRVVFAMPEGGEVPFTLDGLLDACRRWPLHLSWRAQPAPEPERVPSHGLIDLDGLRAQVGVLQALLAEAAVAQYGKAAAARLRKAGQQLGQSLPAMRASRSERAMFQRHVAQATATGLGSARGAATQVQADVGRAYVEMVAAGAMLEARPTPSLLERMPLWWPYLLKPGQVPRDRTAIEMPYRLVGSPLAGAGFTHALRPVVHRGRAELWHTRMGRRGPGGVREGVTLPLRYLWSPDYDPSPRELEVLPDDVFNGALDPLDRRMIVQLTAGYDETCIEPAGQAFVPQPVDVHRLHLSALGGSLDLDKSWRQRPEERPAPGVDFTIDRVDMEAWVHRAHLGRDHYVRVEYAGYLYPFGHAATLVKLSERKVEAVDGFGVVAPLRQRYFVIVRDRIRRYGDDPAMPDAGRSLPFTAIECVTDVTPDLQKPGSNTERDLVENGAHGFYKGDVNHRKAFWPVRSSDDKDFAFQWVGIDHAGRRIPFQCPAMFISDARNHYTASTGLDRVGQHYLGPHADEDEVLDDRRRSRRTPAMGGVSIRMAPDAATDSDVDVPVQAVEFEPLAPAAAQAYGHARFFPGMRRAKVRLQSLDRLAGLGQSVDVVYPPVYRSNGFPAAGATGAANEGQVFLAIEGADLADFAGSSRGDATGGVATPGFVPTALSRVFGLGAGDTGTLSTGMFNPHDFFKGEGATLLGFIPLRLLLKIVPFASVEGAPTFDTRPEEDGSIRTRLLLKETGVKLARGVNDPLPEGDFTKLDNLFRTNIPGKQTSLTLDCVQRTWLDPGRPPETIADGELKNFRINLFGAIVLWFDRLHFRSENGNKPEVDVDLNPDHGVTFGGPLEFVNALKDLIPSNGFSDPPGLAVTPQGITASFSLGLPNVQVGVLALSNITLGASFNLPFTGQQPSLRFNFAERHNTFNLTVSLFGGGGFFAIGVDTGGVREIEAALEFGASIQIDLGVASGSVYVKGGFYFHFEEKNVLFQGYVELGGRLSILGLISASLTFHLSLTYECREQGTKSDGTARKVSVLYGQATLVVEVDVLFFSASVEVRVRREFAGSEADPLFCDFITDSSTWDDYCLAFA